MSKSKIILLILGVPLVVFLLIYAYAFIIESYCWNKGDSLPQEEKGLRVEPTEEESNRGITYQSKYYRIISDCEKQFPNILFKQQIPTKPPGKK